MSTRLPWRKDWVDAYLADARIQSCCAATRGIWRNLECHMHNDDRSGVISGTMEELCVLGGCQAVELACALRELHRNGKGVAVVTQSSRDGHAIVTIVSRDMKEEADNRQAAAIRQVRCRERKRNAVVSHDGHGVDVRRKKKQQQALLAPAEESAAAAVIVQSGEEPRLDCVDALIQAGIGRQSWPKLMALEGISATVISRCHKAWKSKKNKGVGALIGDIEAACAQIAARERQRALAQVQHSEQQAARQNEPVPHATKEDRERFREVRILAQQVGWREASRIVYGHDDPPAADVIATIGPSASGAQAAVDT